MISERVGIRYIVHHAIQIVDIKIDRCIAFCIVRAGMIQAPKHYGQLRPLKRDDSPRQPRQFVHHLRSILNVWARAVGPSDMAVFESCRP